MKLKAALGALSALAHETRLAIFKHLVTIGPEGCPAGDIAAKLKVPPPTMSFHLNYLEQSGLIRARRQRRHIIYSADFARMRELLAFLMEDCCKGRPEICSFEVKACCE